MAEAGFGDKAPSADIRHVAITPGHLVFQATNSGNWSVLNKAVHQTPGAELYSALHQ